MNIKKKDLISLILKIRKDIGHKDVDVVVSNLFFDEDQGNLLIITPDRPEKSVIIGKGGWVVGRLREELGINSIHVEAYSDFIVPLYRMELALDKLEEIISLYSYPKRKPLVNLSNLLKARMENPYNIEFLLRNFTSTFTESHEIHEENNEKFDFKSLVALSGGVDSSASLVIAKMLGFNPLAVTVNPGDIILPRYFRESVENLTRKLGVEHQYLDVDMTEIIDGSLEGRFHPCGKCSKTIEETIQEFTLENSIPFLIYGDLLSTGAQSLHVEMAAERVTLRKRKILRINLPALLSLKKGDVKNIAVKWGVKKRSGYGCPLIGEVHKKQPHMRRFSIQRVLRETKAGALEPGEALDQITGIL